MLGVIRGATRLFGGCEITLEVVYGGWNRGVGFDERRCRYECRCDVRMREVMSLEWEA